MTCLSFIKVISNYAVLNTEYEVAEHLRMGSYLGVLHVREVYGCCPRGCRTSFAPASKAIMCCMHNRMLRMCLICVQIYAGESFMHCFAGVEHRVCSGMFVVRV